MLRGLRATGWLACLALAACGSGGMNMSQNPAPPPPQRGQLLADPPAEVGSYGVSDILSLLGVSTLGKELLQLTYSPTCTVNVYLLEYESVGAQGEPTTASGALMVPSGSDPSCSGPRPIVLYAHGTSADRSYNIANIGASGNDEGLILAAVFAAKGYIVVAPNYAGYDTSTLGYHPYLDADQQSKDMIDALTAARGALPVSSSGVSDDHKLFITGYSQGGYVAMATHRAMQAAGMAVTASGPMSGPYALAAFGDAVFMGDVNLGAVINFVLVALRDQHKVDDRAQVHIAHEDGIAERRKGIRSRHRSRGGDGHAGGLHRAVRRHRHVSALRVARDEELVIVGYAGRRHRQRAACRGQRVDHVLRLLIGVEIGVIAERGCVVAGVVRRDDDVALRGEHRGEDQPFVIAGGADVRDVVAAIRRSAVRIEHDRARTAAGGVGAARHHQSARGRRGLPLRAHALVLE